MILGMPTLIELKTLEENVQLCYELGLDFVEINMNLPQFQTLELSEIHLKELMEKYAVFFTFHIPEDIDVAHFNDKIRTVNHEIVLDTLSLMKAIGSSKLNMHMSEGIYFTLPNEKIYLYDTFNKKYSTNILEFRSKMSQAIKNSKIEIIIENTGIFNKTYIKKAVDILLEKEVFSLTWDIGHDYSSGHLDKSFMEERIGKISHMHVHDAIAEKNHLQLFTGEINIDWFLKLIRERDMTAVIETKTKSALEKSVLELKNRLNGVFD